MSEAEPAGAGAGGLDRRALAVELYRAFAAGDRDAAERLLDDDFHFTSPLDNRLDREGFFAICWPGSGSGSPPEIVHLAEDGDTVLVTYDSGGPAPARNTEVLTFRGDRILETQVFFGWSRPHPVPEGEHRDPE